MNSSIGLKFTTIAEKRFLVHLIIHHGLVLRSNSFQIISGCDFEMKVNLITSFINHSCIPNTIILNKQKNIIAKSILPIKKGEQIFISYMDNEDPSSDVKKTLYHIYGFICDCDICEGSSLEQQDDSTTSYIEAKIIILRENFDLNLLTDLKRHATEFKKRIIVTKYHTNQF